MKEKNHFKTKTKINNEIEGKQPQTKSEQNKKIKPKIIEAKQIYWLDYIIDTPWNKN